MAVLRVLSAILCEWIAMCLEKWDLLRPPGLPVSDFLKLFNAAGL